MNGEIAVLVSGEGSNLQSLFWHGIGICVAVADRDCPALYWAESMRIPTKLVARGTPFSVSRADFTQRVIEELNPYNPELVVLAGFMSILSPGIFKQYPERVLNMHPSLLPELPGANAVKEAYEQRKTRRRTGCTLHVAGPEVDSGRHLVQKEITVCVDDTVHSLRWRIKTVEHMVYPPAVAAYLAHMNGQ